MRCRPLLVAVALGSSVVPAGAQSGADTVLGRDLRGVLEFLEAMP